MRTTVCSVQYTIFLPVSFHSVPQQELDTLRVQSNGSFRNLENILQTRVLSGLWPKIAVLLPVSLEFGQMFGIWYLFSQFSDRLN